MELDITILYEDVDLLVIDKPGGLMVHADGRSTDQTLVDWIRQNRPEIEGVGENQFLQNGESLVRPGIVHRLDRDTSGVLVIAKTQHSFVYLKDQFKNRKVEKTYRAFVYGNFKPEIMEGVIEKPIGRSTSDFRKWSAEFGAKGELREAVTKYKVLKQNKEFAYVEVKPKTGRTHQIRVHLKAISHPVIGDSLYASGKKSGLGFERLALHAFSIKLDLMNGKELTIEAPLPPDFLKAEKELEA
jgi:23S rRNA pseudouridine1911/1915/1917 synthase